MCGQLFPQSFCQSLDAAEKTLAELHCPIMCGVCTPPASPSTSPLSPPSSSLFEVAAIQAPTNLCNVSKCAVTCEGGCGWSRARGLCVLGLTTEASESEERLGECPAKTPSVDDGGDSTSGLVVAAIITALAVALPCGAVGLL